MPTHPTIRRALISVYDKTGVVDFARALHEEFGVELISTGGTAKVLREAGLPVTLIETLTGYPEMLDGRVKTLHPVIHAAILADRDNPEHMRQLQAHGIKPIDLVAVSLYPFEKTIADPNCSFEQAIEMIDIGGVTLLRAAAKNHKHVVVLSDSEDFEPFLQIWRSDLPRLVTALPPGGALAALRETARYDAAISEWLSGVNDTWPHDVSLWLSDWGPMRYGENPHQESSLLSSHADYACNLVFAGTQEPIDEQAQMSHNNYIDADAALGLCAELTRAGAAGAWRRLWHRFPTGGCMHGFPTRASATVSKRVSPRITDEHWTQRNLPHLQVPGATYFVTFRVREGTLSPAERDLVLSACTFWHARKMTLHCACVMPDHVHLLLTPHEIGPDQWTSLGELLHSIKRHSAGEINRQRGTTGARWLDENFDRVMRHEREFLEAWHYIEANPVTAGVVAELPYPWFWRSDAGFGECLLEGDEEMHGLETRANSHRLETGATDAPRAKRLETGATSESPATIQTGQAGATGPTGTAPPAACVFIKHTNACGASVVAPVDGSAAAQRAAGAQAYQQAYLGDPNAAMGGILAVNFTVDAGFAALVMETYARFGKPLKEAGAAYAPGGFFVEVWIAPRFTDDAIAVIRGKYDPATAKPEADEPRLDAPEAPAPKKDWGQRVRLLAVDDMATPPDPDALVYRSIAGGMLVQTPDLAGLNEEAWKVVTQRAPTPAEMDDLRLAWLICKHTKSNAITLCKNGMLLGSGAGQMSRVMSCRLATWLARENGHLGSGEPGAGGEEKKESEAGPTGLKDNYGLVAASDAFFPFPDGPQILIDAGVTALIQPGGGKRDQETIDLCNARGVAMIFTGTRHFRH